jgi:hypothetical protein
MLAIPAWNRCVFDFSHFSTRDARRSTRWIKYCPRSAIHAESSTCCLVFVRSQDLRRISRRSSRSATRASGPVSKNWASVSSPSITASRSRFCDPSVWRVEITMLFLPLVALFQGGALRTPFPRHQARSQGGCLPDVLP